MTEICGRIFFERNTSKLRCIIYPLGSLCCVIFLIYCFRWGGFNGWCTVWIKSPLHYLAVAGLYSRSELHPRQHTPCARQVLCYHSERGLLGALPKDLGTPKLLGVPRSFATSAAVKCSIRTVRGSPEGSRLQSSVVWRHTTLDCSRNPSGEPLTDLCRCDDMFQLGTGPVVATQP